MSIPCSSNSSFTDVFSIHSCYYRDTFLLRIQVSINREPVELRFNKGHPSPILYCKELGVGAELTGATILDVLYKHGVHHLGLPYYESDGVLMFPVFFACEDVLKQFLAAKSVINGALASDIRKSFRDKDTDQPFEVDVCAQLYLLSLSIDEVGLKIYEVTMDSYFSCIEKWKMSKLPRFTSAMFDNPESLQGTTVCKTSSANEASLADLQKELSGLQEWFSLGVALKIPEDNLRIIRSDYKTTAECRLEMLMRWKDMQKATWTKLRDALMSIGRYSLARQIHSKFASANEEHKRLLTEKERCLDEQQKLQASSKERIHSIRKNCTYLEALIQEDKKVISLLNVQLEAKRMECAALQESVKSFEESGTRTILEGMLDEKSREVEDLISKMSVKEEELMQAKEKLIKVEEKYENVVQKYVSEAEKISSEIELLESKINSSLVTSEDWEQEKFIVATNMSIEDLKLKIVGLGEEQESKTSDVEELKQTIDKIEKRIWEVEEQIKGKKLEIMALQGTPSGSHEDSTNVLLMTVSLKMKISELKAKVSQLKIEKRQSEVKIGSTCTAIAHYQKRIKHFEDVIPQLEIESSSEEIVETLKTKESKEPPSYYDVLMIGSAPYGKSTTANKLLVANTSSEDQRIDQTTMSCVYKYCDKIGNFTLWFVSPEKNLVQSKLRVEKLRTRFDDHQEMDFSFSNNAGSKCEVISNDVTRIRVVDMCSQMDMLKMVQYIQTAFDISFRCILYFLPVRGPLEAVTANIKSDIKLMCRHYGPKILKSLVLVATMSSRFSSATIPDDEKFLPSEIQSTRVLFQAAIDECLGRGAILSISQPPLIFVPMTDSCDVILSKVQNADVQNPLGLSLSSIAYTALCTKCKLMIRIVNEEKVACCYDNCWNNAIPYNESKCHPEISSPLISMKKIKQLFQRTQEKGADESCVCSHCHNRPAHLAIGCIQVGSELMVKGRTIRVDHDIQIQSGGAVYSDVDCNSGNSGELDDDEDNGVNEDFDCDRGDDDIISVVSNRVDHDVQTSSYCSSTYFNIEYTGQFTEIDSADSNE